MPHIIMKERDLVTHVPRIPSNHSHDRVIVDVVVYHRFHMWVVVSKQYTEVLHSAYKVDEQGKREQLRNHKLTAYHSPQYTANLKKKRTMRGAGSGLACFDYKTDGPGTKR